MAADHASPSLPPSFCELPKRTPDRCRGCSNLPPRNFACRRLLPYARQILVPPKGAQGRKGANEDILRAAEREGYEESGYRNRLLPLPMRHRQPEEEGREEFVVEPVWTQLMPVSARSQYILFWYVAETVTEDAERESALQETYQAPVAFPRELTLVDRIKIDVTAGVSGEKTAVHEPIRHDGTGVDEEEALYASRLMSVAEACEKLRGSVMEDVVRRGWEAIQTRLSIEAARAGSR